MRATGGRTGAPETQPARLPANAPAAFGKSSYVANTNVIFCSFPEADALRARVAAGSAWSPAGRTTAGDAPLRRTKLVRRMPRFCTQSIGAPAVPHLPRVHTCKTPYRWRPQDCGAFQFFANCFRPSADICGNASYTALRSWSTSPCRACRVSAIACCSAGRSSARCTYALPIDAEVHCHPVQPCRETGLGCVEEPRPLPNSQKCLLRDVIGVSPCPGDTLCH
jgi:hypothetical protein